jgi:hypothetical protein
MIGVRLLVIPLGAAAMVSMLWHHERVRMPLPLWIAATVLLASSVWMRWLVFRHPVGATLRQALSGLLAYMALTHVITVASLTAIWGTPISWQRTDKFKPAARRHAALASTTVESVLAVSCLTVAAAAIAVIPHGGIVYVVVAFVAGGGFRRSADPDAGILWQPDRFGLLLTGPPAMERGPSCTAEPEPDKRKPFQRTAFQVRAFCLVSQAPWRAHHAGLWSDAPLGYDGAVGDSAHRDYLLQRTDCPHS